MTVVPDNQRPDDCSSHVLTTFDRGCTHCVHVCALVLGAVRAVAERLCAAGILTGVGSLSCVRPLVDLQVFESGECFWAPLKLQALNPMNLPDV
jgi:hypothetical protein